MSVGRGPPAFRFERSPSAGRRSRPQPQQPPIGERTPRHVKTPLGKNYDKLKLKECSLPLHLRPWPPQPPPGGIENYTWNTQKPPKQLLHPQFCGRRFQRGALAVHLTKECPFFCSSSVQRGLGRSKVPPSAVDASAPQAWRLPHLPPERLNMAPWPMLQRWCK